MEILNTTEHVLEYWSFIVINGIMLLVFGSAMCVGLCDLIKQRDCREDLGGTIVCILITSILVFTLVMLIKQDVRVTHDVKVTNWNEVYEQNYKVLKQKGEIVTIELK